MSNSILATSVLALVAIGTTGCATHTGEGALIGGASGAAIGAGIGSLSHQRAGEGALLGGIIGAVGGGLVGNEMDRQERGHGHDGGYADYCPQYGYAEFNYEHHEHPPVYRHYHHRWSRHGHWHHHHGHYKRVYCD